MTARSIPHPPNFCQASFEKKERKFCYFSELPISKKLYLALKTSKKEKDRRQAKILDRVHYLNKRGFNNLCYMKDEAIQKYLNESGFECCKRTVSNDLRDLRKMNMLFFNTWRVTMYQQNKKYGNPVKWNGSVRHLVTPWDIHKYEQNYILAINKKGIPKPEKVKKSFYKFKNLVMQQNFPHRHNKKMKIACVSAELTKGINKYPPIIPPKGDEIVKISQKKEKNHHPTPIRRIRRVKSRKKYEKVDDLKIIHALTRQKSGTDALTATTAHAEMENALATMCKQPQFAGREETLRTNFRTAWSLHRDRPMTWKKSPLHLAAHATLNGYSIKNESIESTENSAKIDYTILQPLLKWGVQIDPAPPEPFSPKVKFIAKSLAYELQRDHGYTLQNLGYRAEEYGLRCITSCSDHTVPYDSPYVFSGLMEKCRDRGLVEIAKWFKKNLFKD